MQVHLILSYILLKPGSELPLTNRSKKSDLKAHQNLTQHCEIKNLLRFDEASVSTTSRRDLMTPKLSCWVMSFGLALVCPYTHRICGYPYPINYWVDIAFALDFSSWDWNRTKELAFWDLTVRNGSYLTWELYLQGKYWWIITNLMS